MEKILLSRITQVLSVIETGKLKEYSAVYVFPDGKGGVPQVTLAMGFTQDYNLKDVLIEYVKVKGIYASGLQPYITRMKDAHLYQDKTFLWLLQQAGTDVIMQQVQDLCFFKQYLAPAETWAKINGFKHPLSMLVIADSFLHSGQIRWDIRKMFKAVPPVLGGAEVQWITEYLDARRVWLLSRRSENLKRSVYRVAALKNAIVNNNWDLKKPLNIKGVLV